jgi:hypothetical protein
MLAEGHIHGVTTLTDKTWLCTEIKRHQIMKVTDVRHIVGILGRFEKQSTKREVIQTKKSGEVNFVMLVQIGLKFEAKEQNRKQQVKLGIQNENELIQNHAIPSGIKFLDYS